MADLRRIVITGATGNIGTKLRHHLQAKGGYELRLICLNPNGDPAVVTADLSRPDPAWMTLFEGADAVVHLAGLASNQAGWGRLTAPNIDAVLQVYLAAARLGVRRVVAASSVWAQYGHRHGKVPLSPSQPANPVNPYGVSKMVGERIGQCFYEQFAITGVGFRIGACRRVENRPDLDMTRGDWEQSCWVSDRDTCQGLELAATVDYDGFHVLNLTSANVNTRWDIAPTRALLGYAPQDGHTVRVRPVRRLQSAVAKFGRVVLPRWIERTVDHDW